MAMATHLLGPSVVVDGLYRQRCCWCGALLYEGRVRLTAKAGVPVSYDDETQAVTVRPVGVDYPDACSKLDPAVTR